MNRSRELREERAPAAARTMTGVTVRSLITAATICLLSGYSAAQQLPANAPALFGEKEGADCVPNYNETVQQVTLEK